jgi:hypothetical protein
MKGIRKTEVGGDVLDEGAGLGELAGGVVHFETRQELVWRLMVIAPEEAADVGGIEVAIAGDLAEGAEPPMMGADVLAAMLVGDEGEGIGAFERRAGLEQFDAEAFEEAAAKIGRVPGAARAAADEFIDKRLNFGGGEDLRDRSGGKFLEPKPLRGVVAGEIHKVFHERRLGVRNDVMRDAGSVGKNAAWTQFKTAAAQFQLPAALGDVFNRMKRESFPANGVVRGAMLHAAANDGEMGGARRIEIEIKPAGRGDLGRKEIGGAWRRTFHKMSIIDMYSPKVDIPKSKRQDKMMEQI